MDTKKLRQKILDLAIHGKLVPQDPNDEPAAVVLERIRAEKERLVKEGKIKKSKSSRTTETPHYEQMPEGWCITNIGDLLINRDGERKPVSSAIRSKQVNKIYDYYGAAGVIDKVDDYIFDERLLLIGEDGANLLSRSKDNAFFAEGKYWVNNHAHVLDATDKFILDYVAIVINAMKLDDYVTGSAQPKLSQDNLNKIPIYLPPLEEQKRILVEINRLFDLIYKLELGKADLQTAIKQTKSKILDLAIHGKLVPQDPNDEPASDLLKRINPKAEITCDNGQYGKVTFEIPYNWCWQRLGDINDIARGGSPRPIKDYLTDDEDGVNWIKIGDTSKDEKYINSVKEKIRVEGVKKSRMVHKGDFLLTNSMSFGRPYILNVDGCIHDGWLVISPKGNAYNADFLYYLLSSTFAYDQFAEVASGGVVTNLNSDKVADTMFPLPPLPEQYRIVAKIEELFTSLDNIQKALEV